MAKKQSKKKGIKKKDIKKKKALKLKLKKKKNSKKKNSKKKDSKKKEPKKKAKLKESGKKPVVQKPAVVEKPKPEAQSIKTEDHSSNYNVTNAVKKLRALKKRDELLAFTKGEKRLTITKAVRSALNRLK